MHLMAHITERIIDHGPVYAFWLYAFERMNGILGSFPTNNIDTSVQLMRKFTRMQEFCIDEWPEDVKEELSSIIKDHSKIFESKLLLTSAECNAIKPLPPVLEQAFTDEEKEKVISLIVSLGICSESEISVVRLYRQSKAILLNSSIKLASKSSPYPHSSKVFIGSDLIEIEYFVYCTVMVTDIITRQCTKHQHWLVCGLKFESHNHKVWFGSPTQIWATTTESDFFYAPVTSMTDRVVFVKATVNLGRIVGDDTVLVVVPIPLQYAE